MIGVSQFVEILFRENHKPIKSNAECILCVLITVWILFSERKPFSCNQCHKSYAKRSTLKRHQKEECRKERQNVCPICHKAFHQLHNLKRHLKTHKLSPDLILYYWQLIKYYRKRSTAPWCSSCVNGIILIKRNNLFFLKVLFVFRFEALGTFYLLFALHCQ